MHILPCGHGVCDPGQTHYCTYLRLDELLRLQPEAERLRHPDEHLFVVTHQAFEVWFSQLRFDLKRIIDALQRDDVGLATWLTQRCTAITRLFSPMMRVLETMTPSDFYAFRAHLSPASGGESWQWHEVELLAGAREEILRRQLESELSDEPGSGVQAYLWTEKLARMWEEPSVASECLALFRRRGVEPADVYRVAPADNPHADLVLLSEALMDFDEEVKVWRFVHARTAERTIGPDNVGTGHTTGVRYLDAAAVHRELFFPFLWNARGVLWERAQGGG
ncbi:MAG TPA: tryptophan 2,3-dioxygenase family protein [Longimicrobiaceae bacterium]|nr:tryptophan 2,3-dioxygenase family protein [Longimicrobiaceae bacterium]